MRSIASPSSMKTGCRRAVDCLVNRPGKKPGYGNRGKTNCVFPPFPQPLLLLTNYDKKQRPKNNNDRLHKILDRYLWAGSSPSKNEKVLALTPESSSYLRGRQR